MNGTTWRSGIGSGSLAAAIAMLIAAAPVTAPRALAGEVDDSLYDEELGLDQLKCPVTGPAHRAVFRYSHEISEVSTGEIAVSSVDDVLIVTARDNHALCFGLITFGRNYHMCHFAGVAASAPGNAFVFREHETVIRFELIDATRVRVTPSGEGYKENCGMWGVIEPGTYTLRDAPTDASKN